MNIAIRNLTKTFGSLRANDGICLSFAAGQIHGILGENGAGKSTLMKLLSGFLRRDSGDMLLDNRPVDFKSPADGLRAGVGMVYQEPLDVPAFSALENMYCGSLRQVFPTRAAARKTLLRLASETGFSVDPDATVGQMTVGQRQQLEIMRLLACGTQILILDEPTTGITASQKDALFAALKRLASEGKTILYVSHKLEEVAELCHTVSVLRAGKVVGDGQMTMPQPQRLLLEYMFGSEIHTPTLSAPVQAFVPSLPHPVWRLDHVTLRDGSLELRNLNLDINAGMVLGLAGLAGSGQHLLLRVLTGIVRPSSGRVLLNGYDKTGAPLADFLSEGVHFVPADRLTEGLIGAFSLADHIALLKTTSVLLKNRQQARAEAEATINEYHIHATPTSSLESLSGGNQQRALLSLLPARCTGLLLEQPTRGLDVTAAWGVWQRLQARCADGTALVFASADLDELLEYSDSVLVFCGGRVSRPLPRAELSAPRLAALIGGVGFEE